MHADRSAPSRRVGIRMFVAALAAAALTPFAGEAQPTGRIAVQPTEQLASAAALRLSPRDLKILQTKPKVSPQVASLFRIHQGKPLFRAAPDREFELIPLDKMEFTPSPAQIQQSTVVPQNVLAYQQYYRVARIDPAILGQLLCTGVDRRAQQTSIKDQANRGTCVAHAALAALEVAYKPLSLDLSENYGYYKFEGSSESEVCLDNGLNTLTSGQLMTDHGMSAEACWPYVGTLAGIGCPVPIETAWPIATCSPQAKYGVTSHHQILRKDDLAEDVGEWINNPKYLESVLCAGHDIVTGFHVVGWPSGVTGVIDAVQGSSIGGHAMVIVGFVRTNVPAHGGGYFILKNSWGPGLGQSGYVYLSYDYIRVYSKYGYYLTGVKPVPTLTLPPYNQLISTKVQIFKVPPKVPTLTQKQKPPLKIPVKTVPR